MPRTKAVAPTYRLHKPSGRAVAYVDRKPVYLGPYGSPDSKRAFAALLDRLAQGETPAITPKTPCGGLTVAELCSQFIDKEFPRFSESERHCFRTAIRVVRQLFGDTLVAEFGPLRFRMMRDAMVLGAKGADLPLEPDGTVAKDRRPWCRRTANRQSKRIRQIFRWGVSHELTPVEVLHRLDTVRALAIGETTAVDYDAREAVPEADLAAVRAVLREKHRDVFDLMLLTGARPGELLSLTGDMLERRGPAAWVAELQAHKTARKGKRRFLVFNTAAQAILLRYLKPDLAERLFPVRRDSFTAAVRKACERADVTPFVPHQLRHTVSTRLVDTVGLEGAQHVLGHSDAAMTLHYSRLAERAAVAAVQRLG